MIRCAAGCRFPSNGPDGYCGVCRWVRRWRLVGPLALEHWPPLPAGRRPRALERARRRRVVMAARAALAGVLVRRLRSLVPPLRPEPQHGPRCTGADQGCPDCHAIASWRVELEVLSGAPSAAHGYLFP